MNKAFALPLLPRLALILNIAVLVPVCTGLLTDAAWTLRGYGDASDGRDILLALYLALLAASVTLLIRPDRTAISTLLALQVVYKLLTPFTTGTLSNPVVLSNIGIALFHLVVLWRLKATPDRLASSK